jgi:hypothetical protein
MDSTVRATTQNSSTHQILEPPRPAHYQILYRLQRLSIADIDHASEAMWLAISMMCSTDACLV